MASDQNKLAVVSGGTKGIGRAIIEKFMEEGFDIITCSRNEEDLEAMKSELQEKYSGKVYISQVDMSEKEEVIDFIDFIKLTGRSVDVLVNNAGVFLPGTVHEESDGSLELMINTNLYSAYYLSRGIIPGMKERKSGHIFNICSIASIKAYENGGSYGISKFAMYGMSKSLREELKPDNIRVTAILPGATYTSSWESVDLPEHRFMTSEDIAEAVFMCYNLKGNTVVEDMVLRPQLGDI
ncbi:MAG: SDR family oxidoreductase [bacterium]|nr:SDR family oxidoreductase [bacterium]